VEVGGRWAGVMGPVGKGEQKMGTRKKMCRRCRGVVYGKRKGGHVIGMGLHRWVVGGVVKVSREVSRVEGGR